MPRLTRTNGLSDYPVLLNRVKKTLIEGQQRIEAERVRTYWETGRVIHTHILKHKDRAKYGEEVLARLAKDIDVSETVLHRCLKFAQSYPILARGPKFSWSHYRKLMTIPDREERLLLEKQIGRNDWTAQELAARIKDERPLLSANHQRPLSPKTNHLPPKLNAQRGTLYTYHLAEAVTPLAKGNVFVDCGFRAWYPARCALRSLPKGVIVETILSGNSFEVIKSARAEKDLYTYKAYLKILVDADTPWAEIDLGLGGVTLQKMRLRGIDAPEINTAAGRRAKRFVEKLLKPCPFIIVKTYKDQSDKYDRYLVDVYFKAGETDPAVVAATGEYLNQRLLDEGLAVKYEE